MSAVLHAAPVAFVGDEPISIGQCVWTEPRGMQDQPRGGRVWNVTTLHDPDTGMPIEAVSVVDWCRGKPRFAALALAEVNPQMEPLNRAFLFEDVRKLLAHGGRRRERGARWTAEDSRVVEAAWRLSLALD